MVGVSRFLGKNVTLIKNGWSCTYFWEKCYSYRNNMKLHINKEKRSSYQKPINRKNRLELHIVLEKCNSFWKSVASCTFLKKGASRNGILMVLYIYWKTQKSLSCTYFCPPVQCTDKNKRGYIAGSDPYKI